MSPDGGSDRARKVFVVHGRNREARAAMFTFLRAIGLAPIEWSEAVRLTGEASPYIGHVLDAAFGAAQAIVVLLTPDDVAYLRSEYASGDDDPETTPLAQARPNVLFEAGPPIVASHLAVNASQSIGSSSLPWRLARFASSVMNSISRAFGARPYLRSHWRASAAALRVTARARVEYASSVCCAMPSISCPRPSSRLRNLTPNSRASAEYTRDATIAAIAPSC